MMDVGTIGGVPYSRPTSSGGNGGMSESRCCFTVIWPEEASAWRSFLACEFAHPIPNHIHYVTTLLYNNSPAILIEILNIVLPTNNQHLPDSHTI